VSASVLSAAQAANAATFVDGFRHKYKTRAGEFGSQLSGGQKQRLAIARCVHDELCACAVFVYTLHVPLPRSKQRGMHWWVRCRRYGTFIFPCM
jgi:hypothetical protein